MTSQPPRSPDETAPAALPCVDVLLISMPFGPLFQPSIGLSLLQAALAPHKISSYIYYATMEFATEVGVPLYTEIANGSPATYDLLGEWLFSTVLFGTSPEQQAAYIEDVLRGRHPAHQPSSRHPKEVEPNFIEQALGIRAHIEAFLARCAERIVAARPRIIGFTSVFQQHVASLCLAQLLKQRLPDSLIVFGGANCEGVMGLELLRQFPFVDAVVSGEGDIVFPQLVRRVLDDQPFAQLHGVSTQATAAEWIGGQVINAPSVLDMDALPLPRYDDFFAQWHGSGLSEAQLPPPRLLFETARGCWWGQKHHCTFCGLNGSTMTFRSKSPQRALDELIALTSAYPGHAVSVVDNILDIKYLQSFVPALAERQLELELFYEVKANLRKEQLRLMRDAGITSIQPGIESLSNEVLRLMQKGISGLQNIQLLKWCKEFGVTPYWNMLWGFPNEPPASYSRMAELLPYLSHLRPPGSASRIRLDRFSPNFDEAAERGFCTVEPYPAYRYIYPLAPAAVANLAYFFTYGYATAQDVESYTEPLMEQIATWKRSHADSELLTIDKQSCLLIWDLRPCASQPLTVLDEPLRTLYQACDSIQSAQALSARLAEDGLPGVSALDIDSLLEPLIEQGLMLRDGHSYLSLALTLDDYAPSAQVLQRLYDILLSLGTETDGQIVVALPSQQEVSSATV